ncbi:hypothetical protein G8770_18775 [Aestuariicella hydrocarbonica]|uniref:DUF2007 domain-containing protein n=1 Tax=Pseudomaricurvus hydrocarbonicus TaxID=1470433 RepID=A0A9E5MNN7_9GAMM|nr:DUF6164 family protein [Aestuariicella hydrocarbonica]NHO67595.1 hypothetical protein [Aestuariicella hydrocarbonica]
MAELLFKLNGVPDDEAMEVRELLAAANVDYYETTAGNWGVSLAAIWLKDDRQLEQAKALIDSYQEQRLERTRQQAQLNPPEPLLRHWLRYPLRVVAMLIVVAAVLYVSIVPFLSAWELRQ